MIDRQDTEHPAWERHLRELLPLFGHRNWIVVADAAYPAQTSGGIETMIAHAEHLDVVRTVAGAIAEAIHIRPNIHVDQELDFVAEEDAPGITDYKTELMAVLGGAHVDRVPHEEIIARLDQSAKVFRILLIKTDSTMPYSSVFFELDCGYWNAEAEQRLRQSLLSAK